MRHAAILAVNPDREALDADQEVLERCGVTVTTCLGPERRSGCPLLRGEFCMRMEDNDGILLDLDLDLADHRHVLHEYLISAQVPIRVIVSPEQAERWDELLRYSDTIVGPPSEEALERFAELVISSSGCRNEPIDCTKEA